MSINLSELSGRKGLEENLFDKLGQAAKETGSPSVSSLKELADTYLMGKANLYGTSSFYDFTREDNQGKKVYVCNGSACLCAGTQPDVEEKLHQHFKEEEIGTMCCLGRCHENAAFHYQGVNYSGQAISRLDEMLRENTTPAEQANDRYEVACLGTAVLSSDFESSYSIDNLLDTLHKKSPEEWLEEIRVSGLRGRGGAGFPMAFKLDACRKAAGDTKYVVCNADEGDPGAYSDRYLLEQQALRVIWGMYIAGYVLGAQEGVMYIRAEYPEAVRQFEKALQRWESQHQLWTRDGHEAFPFKIYTIAAQGAYICGEETALLSSIEGQRPEVRVRPPYPAQKGLFNKPTVVQNVETLACLPFILMHGGETFASIGNGKSTGTKLVSLDRHFNRPGIYEADMGTPLARILEEGGKGFREPVKALHIGGPLGGLVPATHINQLTLDFESFQQQGFLLGHASVVCLPRDFSILTYIEHLFRFTAHESCGKCFPCRIGSTRGYEMIAMAQEGKRKINRELLTDLLETLESGSLCALGGGLPLPIRNALQYFEDEMNPWLE